MKRIIERRTNVDFCKRVEVWQGYRSGLETGRLHGGEPENGHSYLRQDVG